VDWLVKASVLEKCAVSVFSPEDGDSSLLRNVGFSMLTAVKYSNESRNSLARGRMLSLLNDLQQFIHPFTPVIILMILFCNVYTFLLFVEFPQKITPYNDMMEWK
jgi:hypothetical protein